MAIDHQPAPASPQLNPGSGDTSSLALPRVVLLTSPSLYGAIIMNTLARHPGLNLVGIGLTNRVYKGKGPLQTARTFIRRTGWPYTWLSAVANDVSWSLLRARGRPKGIPDLYNRARPIHDINGPDALDWLRDLQPDYIASYYFNQWIGGSVRTIPTAGCVNMHPSLLPALRGPDPIFRTLERGLQQTGLTIHAVEDGFDTGHILHQEQRPVPPGSSVLSLYARQARDGAQVLADWLAARNTNASSRPTAPAAAAAPPAEIRAASETAAPPAHEGDYNTFPTPAEVRAFLRSGKRLYSTGEWWRVLRNIE